MDMHTEKGTDHNIAAQVFPNITHLCNQHPDQDTAHSQCPKTSPIIHCLLQISV